MSQDSLFHATTILAVKKDGHTAVAGDGQVTMGNAVIMKNTARKVRRLYHGRVIAGFAGSVADAFALFDKFEARLSDCNGNLVRAAVEFAKEWRRDRVLQKLEALLIMTDGEHLFLVSERRSHRAGRRHPSHRQRWKLRPCRRACSGLRDRSLRP